MNTFSEVEIEVARQLMQFCRELRDLKKKKHEQQQQQQQQTTWTTIINDNHEDEEENGDESKGSNKEALSSMIENEDEEGEYGNGMMRPIRKRKFRSMEFIYKSTEPLVKLVVSHDINANKKRIRCNY